MNTIPADQQTPRQLARLAAQRQLYSDVKFISGLQMMLAACTVVLCFLVPAFPTVRDYVSAWGMVLTFLEMTVFRRRQVTTQELAAKIQELFDCDVLQLDWNELKVGKRPDPELIHQHAQRYRRRHLDYSALNEWYPPVVGEVPLEYARIICQRSNCWWDASMRHRYAAIAMTAFVLLLLAAIATGFWKRYGLDTLFLRVVSPLAPALYLTYTLAMDQRAAATSADRLKYSADNLWSMALQNAVKGELVAHSRALQDEIYDHRRKAPPIFDFLYLLFRRNNNVLTTFVVEEMVADYLRRSR